MSDCKHGKIYKLVSNQTDQIYIGSTAQKYLCSRLHNHKSDYKKHQNGKHRYVTSFDIIKLGDAKIILLEKYSCNSKEELTAREEYWRKKLEHKTVNKQVCSTGINLNYRENKQEYMKQYQQMNREKLLEYYKSRYQNKKEQINKRNMDNYYKHRNERSEKAKAKTTCSCGVEIRKADMNRHRRTVKHRTMLNDLFWKNYNELMSSFH